MGTAVRKVLPLLSYAVMISACGSGLTGEQLVQSGEAGYSACFMITGTGIIIETGSNSADDSFVKGYRIKDDELVEVAGGYTRQRELTEDEMCMFRSVTDTEDPKLTSISIEGE